MMRSARMNHRQRLIGAALVVTLIAVAWAASLDEVATGVEVVQAQSSGRQPTRASAASVSQPSQEAVASSASLRMPWREPAADELLAWGAGTAAPAPQPSQVLATPVAEMGPTQPVAPPFPYQLFGRLEEDGKVRAMLMSSHRTLVVQEGELIDAQWRVERIASDGLGLIWLPARQALHIPFKA